MARVCSRRRWHVGAVPAAPRREPPGAGARSAGRGLFGRLLGTAGDLAPEPRHRVVAGVDHALLHRDDAVVRDLYVLGAHLGAALGDVAHAQAAVVRQLPAVVDVEWMHLELGEADEESGPGVVGLVVLVVTDDGADVLAHEAL